MLWLAAVKMPCAVTFPSNPVRAIRNLCILSNCIEEDQNFRHLVSCRNKHQKQQQYPLNREGFDMITADLKLMCDNCRTYNTGNQDLEESANLMWTEATKQLEVHYQKALSEIASLMSGQRAR